MEDNLVGYLFEVLDPDLQREVEVQLQARPELRARLDLLRRGLAPLEADADDPAPPPGLVLGTLARVAEQRCRSLPPAPLPTPHQRVGRSRRVPRRADLLVAAGLLLVIGGMAAPGLARLWRSYENRTVCANNLRVLGNGLQTFSDFHEGEFPAITDKGSHSVAGIFVPVLHEAGTLPADASLVCPSEGGRPQPVRRPLSELEALYRDQPEEFDRAARDLAGSYAYSLGYQEGGRLQQLRSKSDNGLPILADRVPCLATGNSPNHGGAGQNVLHVGGNVRWCSQRTVGVGGDDIYLNRNNKVGAGVNREDTVLGCSENTPLP